MCWLAAISMLGVAACGGDESSDDTDPPPPPATTEAPETTRAPTTPPPTDPPPATTTASTTTTTTLAPTTTEDPAQALAADVEAAYLEANELRYTAAMDPNNPERVAAALGARVDPSRTVVGEELDGLARDGLRIVANDRIPADIRVEEVSVSDDAASATVVACVTDSWILVESGAGPGGSDAIVDDTVAAYRSVAGMELRNGAWLVATVVEEGAWLGSTTCEAP